MRGIKAQLARAADASLRWLRGERRSDTMPAETVLVTGASSGIGFSVAQHLAALGYRVFGASRSKPQGAQGSIGFEWIEMDVRIDDSIRGAVQGLAAKGVVFDAVICNAGYGVFGSVEEVTIERAKALFETNFFGTLRTLQAVLPDMRARRAGRAIVVGSLAGRCPIPFYSHYSATKAALEATCLALRAELHPHQVHISLLEPGDLRTAFNDAVDGDPRDSAYGLPAERASHHFRVFMDEAPLPDAAARAVARILAARRPRARYTVGDLAYVAPLLCRLLPDQLLIEMLRRRYCQ